MTDKEYTFKTKDVFQEIPGDDNNINMVIPPEIMEAAGIQEGDTVAIAITEDGKMTLKKANNGEE